jgi:hypothetical protein
MKISFVDVGTNMEIGCLKADYLLVSNGHVGDNGLFIKGCQMRSPQGYQSALGSCYLKLFIDINILVHAILDFHGP